MAHELEMLADNTASMAYVGDLPWHGLGVKVAADLTPEQMMQAANLDWEVEKTPLYTRFKGDQVRISDKYALTRSSDGRVLDVVGDGWNPVQNREAFQFFNDFVAAGDMEMHTAGSLKEGRNVWALAKINESFDILGGDQVDGYLLFSNPHQYGKTVEVRFTPIRVVCNNTLTMALNQNSAKVNSMVRLNHRSVFDGDAVKEVLGVSKEKLAKYKEMAQFLSTKRYTNENIVEYFNRVFPMTSGAKADEGKLASRAANTAFEVLDDQPGAEFGRGTWWSAFNAVTYTTDHLLGRSADTRMQSAWFGSNQKRKIDAANLAMEMAEVA
jgi:phage/plasmid-like protein (TIGR03299 family)